MINPMIFYWIDVVEGVNTILCIVTAFSCIVAFFAGMFLFLSVSDHDENGKKLCWEILKISLLVIIISGLLLMFIPSEKALIRILIANNLTGENIEEAAQFVIDTIKKFKE